MSLLILGVVCFLFPGPVRAAPVYDQTNGTWTDSYSDNSGVPTRSDVDVDTSDGKLKLTNAGGGFTPPYYTSGYARTTSIIPTSVALWGNITFSAETPTGTSINIQVLDEGNTVYSDTLLSGNESGFTSSSIDISSLSVTKIAGNNTAKFARLRLKITLSTTDTNVTPAIDSLVLSWIVSQGDTSASTLANTAWPITDADKKGTRHVSYYSNPVYPAIRWIKNQEYDYGGYFTRGKDEIIFHKGIGGQISWPTVSDAKLSAINRNTGATVWEKLISGYAYSEIKHTVSENGTLYIVDQYNDIFLAYDTSDGSLKWTYQFGSTHGNGHVAIADDGTLYTVRFNGTFTVYAFNPNGSIKWTKNIDPPDSVSTSPVVIGNNGAVIFGTLTYNSSNGDRTNHGELYALDPSDGSIDWQYSTGDNKYITPIIDTDGTIYTAHTNSLSIEKKIYAIKFDGTLKWERSIGTSTDSWSFLSLRSDGILLAGRWNGVSPYPKYSYIEAINTSDGSLAWSHANNDYLYGVVFTDGLNGYYYADRQGVNYTEGDTTPESTRLYYFDSSANQKWSLIHEGNVGFKSFMMDEDGQFYGNLRDSTNNNNTLFALFPWTLSVSTDASSYNHSGDTITFTVTTAMQETNLLSGDSNQVQVYVDNGDKVALSYSSTNGDGDTIWTGAYTLPSGISDGNHSFTVEANAAGIETDIATQFTTAATDSNNTGYTTTGSFTIDNNGPSVDLISPKSYTKDDTKPTLSFKKATDAVSGVTSSYSVNLDSGKNRSFSTSGIPLSGNGSSSYIWKNDNDVRIEYLNENDSDSSNDEIKAYFKGLDSGELTEGKHSWNVTSEDNASNSKTNSIDFYIDKTSPSISDLAIADVASVSQKQVYRLKITQRMPSFSGKASDSYQGSERTNSNGTKDTFEKVSSGPEKIALNLKKLARGGAYDDYLTQEYSLTDIQDDTNNEKYSRFFITTPYPLKDGYYQVNLSLKDKGGNTYNHDVFYLTINYRGPLIGGVPGRLETKIIKEEKIPAETEEEKERIKEEGYIVQIKVVDEKTNPVQGAKVTLFSEPREEYTNEEGITFFEGVEPGEHRILIVYNNQEGEQQINLTGDIQEFHYDIQIKETNPFVDTRVILTFFIFLAVIISLLFYVFILKKRK